MFDKLKAMGAMAALMKDQDRIAQAMARVKERMAETRVVGHAGAGACRVTMTGQMRVLDVQLSTGLIAGMGMDEKTRSLAGSLIADAVNDAQLQAQARLREEIEREARELGVPELAGGLENLLR